MIRAEGTPIPFNKASFAGNEQRYIADAMAHRHISGDGPFTKACESFLCDQLGAPRALLTTNCTHALEMAAMLLEVEPGDEVIIPSFTFVSTANAFALRGAKPVFVDVRPDTLNLDERKLEAAITPRTRAIVPVHYAGIACEMDTILDIAHNHSLKIVEDNAHGLFGRYRGRLLGTIGTLATQSFHETKNFTCGEGGALIVNDDRYIERAEIVREKGTNRSRFFRGQVDKYTWVDMGSSYVPSELLAAFLYAQFEARERIQTKRRGIWETYERELSAWSAFNGVTMPTAPAECEPSYHLFYLLLPTPESSKAFMAHLRTRGITAVSHYVPLNRSEMAERLGLRADCPVTENVADRLVRLPFYNDLTSEDQSRVLEAIHDFRTSA